VKLYPILQLKPLNDDLKLSTAQIIQLLTELMSLLINLNCKCFTLTSIFLFPFPGKVHNYNFFVVVNVIIIFVLEVCYWIIAQVYLYAPFILIPVIPSPLLPLSLSVA